MRVNERRDILTWLLLCAVGGLLTWVAISSGARISAPAAPFLGRYRLEVGAASVLAPVVAAAVLILAVRGWFSRARWNFILTAGYIFTLCWIVALAIVDGASGLTRALLADDGYLTDVSDVGTDPFGYLASFTARPEDHSDATRGHPPGPVLLLWLAQRAGLTDHTALGLLLAAVGALAIPLVLSAVRGVCGEGAARRYLPVLVLAPYAVWSAVSMDAVVSALGAAMVAAGVYASSAARRGLAAAGGAVLAGALLGLAALLSYAAPWLGLSLVCLYFARRRPFLNAATGFGALLPIAGAELAGFGWVDGLMTAQADYATRIGPMRSPWWWGGLSLVVLLLATGPALVASLRKVRNTPGWPFLVGAGAAVAFTVIAGLARGGVEHAWLPCFPWLTVAAVAPERQGGELPPTPLLLAGAGAVTAIAIQAALHSPW